MLKILYEIFLQNKKYSYQDMFHNFHFKKYMLVAKNMWDQATSYRLNFVMWRFRQVLQLLTVYFLWSAILPPGKSFVGYNQSLMLTYIFGTSLVNSIILSSRIWEVADEINTGMLSNLLLRPMNYFVYWFFKNLGDKGLNVVFSVIEITILYIILRPNIYIQTNGLVLVTFILSLAVAMSLQFCIDFLLSFVGFWSSETWAPRFIFYMLISFFSGGLFPLDILPKGVYLIFQSLPFAYLLYFPLKIYLGNLSLPEIVQGLLISVLWTIALVTLMRFVWRKGLLMYTAQGS